MLQAQSKQKKKNRPQSAPVRVKSGASVMKGDYTAMLNDPCQANLVPGFYGSAEGYLARFHSVVTPHDIASGVGGAILWIPDYHCIGPVGATETRYNMLSVAVTDNSANFNIDGYGTPATVQSRAVVDPAYSFASGTTCGDARTISACMRLTYLGTMSNARGMVGVIDVPFSVLEDRIRGGTLSVNSLFTVSQLVQRLPLDPLEQKWTPSQGSDTFKGPGDTAGLRADFCVAVSGGVFSLGDSVANFNPRIIGFVWKGTGTGVTLGSELQFDCYKNIEWRPEAASGLTVPTPTRTHVIPPAQIALSALDSNLPGWRSKAMKAAESGASKIAKKALAYSGQLVMRNAPKMIGFLGM